MDKMGCRGRRRAFVGEKIAARCGKQKANVKCERRERAEPRGARDKRRKRRRANFALND